MKSTGTLNSGGKGGSGSKKHRERKTGVAATAATSTTATTETSTMTRSTSLLGMPSLREFYDAAVQTRDQSLAHTGTGTGLSSVGASAHELANESSSTVSSSSLSLGSLYLDYTGPLLRQFVDGWAKNVKFPGGYGNVVGKRNAGNVEAPSLQQWMAGCLGVCEALGISTLTSPPPRPLVDFDLSGANPNTAESAERNGHDQPQPPSKMNVSGGRRSGSSKRYSQRCANMVQKKIQDYVLTDDVMEELYGQKPDLAATTTTTRAHSERYHQLKADQASKLFQSLAHRR
ncbi:hypothetical protein BGZ58_007755 [Dissophora ornata]|nr:hypothetical protein BGZ58_007755 [Dissophora ornata]